MNRFAFDVNISLCALSVTSLPDMLMLTANFRKVVSLAVFEHSI
jgi:type III secretory pathway component EscT